MQQVQQMFLLQHSSAVCRNFQKIGRPVKIRFDEIYQFAAGSATVSVTRFAERSKNSEGLLTSDIDSKTDRLETAC